MRVTRVHEPNPSWEYKDDFSYSVSDILCSTSFILSGAGLPEAGELAGQPAAHLVVSSALF